MKTEAMVNPMGNQTLKHSFRALALILVASAAWAGGTTGGGGNVRPAEQVRERDLIRSVQLSKPIIVSWLSKGHGYYQMIKRIDRCSNPDNQADCTVFAKLFDAKPSIFELIDTAEIETRVNAPCLDLHQQPNDGSMYGERPGSICISISNIKSKLRRDNYENQIAALVMHEMSHLAGTTEEEADRLQLSMLERDLASVPARTVLTQQYMLRSAFKELRNMIEPWGHTMALKDSFNGSCKETEKVLDAFYETHNDYVDVYHFNHLSPRYEALYWGHSIKLRAFWNYLCSQDPETPQMQREMAESIYKLAFGEKSEVTAPEFGGGFRDRASPEVMIAKITDRAIFESEIAGINKIFSEITEGYQRFMEEEFTTYSTSQP